MDEIDLIESLLPAVEQQLNSPDTPFVKETHTRLVSEKNLTEDDALHAIALCLADESNRMFIDKRPFDLTRYKTLLQELPTLPEG